MDLAGAFDTAYFGGGLSAGARSALAGLDDGAEDAVALADRVFRLMRMAGIDAPDVAVYTARQIGSDVPRTVPSAWHDSVPPLTLPGRHGRLDRYVADNSWHRPRHGVLLDLGCGIPPVTTLETARELPDWRVIGADPAFAHRLVYDDTGRYALVDTELRLRYVQSGNTDPNPAATRDRFTGLAADLLANRPSAGARLVTDPAAEFARDNVTFLRGGIGDLDLPEEVDVIRCMNVLMYFDHGFRVRMLDWAAGLLRPGGLLICGSNWALATSSRYTVYQKEGAGLVPREFAFAIENVRPFELAPWYALHDDNAENLANAHTVGLLRRDATFRTRFDTHLDALLANLGVCARDPAGYLGDCGRPPDEMATVAATLADELEPLVDDAVATLRRAGHHAWRNAAGHVAVRPFTPPQLRESRVPA